VFRTETAVELTSDGTAEVAYEVPQLRLLGGDYDLAVGAPELDRTVHFSVPREPVDMGGSWQVPERAR
jgi:hypothetical protein